MGRVEAVPLGAIVGLLIGACFVKPTPPGGADPDGGAAADGNSVLDGSPTCALRDTFDSGSALCGGWGSNAGSGSHNATRNGQLLFFATAPGGTAACQGTIDVPFTSVVVQIAAIVHVAGAHTGVELSFDDGQTFTLDIESASDTSASVTAIHDTQATALGNYSGSSLQYVRFRKRGPSQIDLSFSSDDSSWQPPDMFVSTSTLGRVKVRLYASFGPNVTEFVTASFDNLDGCAP